jgi:hypothetical protein
MTACCCRLTQPATTRTTIASGGGNGATAKACPKGYRRFKRASVRDSVPLRSLGPSSRDTSLPPASNAPIVERSALDRVFAQDGIRLDIDLGTPRLARVVRDQSAIGRPIRVRLIKTGVRPRTPRSCSLAGRQHQDVFSRGSVQFNKCELAAPRPRTRHLLIRAAREAIWSPDAICPPPEQTPFIRNRDVYGSSRGRLRGPRKPRRGP